MLWVAIVYLIAQVVFIFVLGVRLKPKEWTVLTALWTISIFMCVMVRFHLWPSMEPLVWVRVLFEPPTNWLLKGL